MPCQPAACTTAGTTHRNRPGTLPAVDRLTTGLLQSYGFAMTWKVVCSTPLAFAKINFSCTFSNMNDCVAVASNGGIMR